MCHDKVFYILMQVLSVLGAIGLILQGARIYWGQRGLRHQRWQSLVLLVSWLLIIWATFVRRVQLTGESEGRQLYPAIAAIAFFMFAGVTAWAPRRYGTTLAILVLVALVSVSALAPTRYILPAYAQPTRLTIEQAPATMNDVILALATTSFC
jgi:cytochrome bd-type quinol oxidase subunit 2